RARPRQRPRPGQSSPSARRSRTPPTRLRAAAHEAPPAPAYGRSRPRSEEHTSELQSLTNLVCRLLLEKKKTSSNKRTNHPYRTSYSHTRSSPPPLFFF